MNTTKKILSALTITLAAVAAAGSSAHARSLMPPVWDAELTRFDIDEQLPYAKQVSSAKVEVNYAKGYVELTLYRRFHCPAGAMCAQVMPAPLFFKLPIAGVRKTDCGSREILAKQDRRMVDGALQVIELRDNTGNHCPTFVALPSTEVLYKTQSSGMGGHVVETRSTFTGEPLRPVYYKSE